MDISTFLFGAAIVLKVSSGAVQTYAIVVQSTAVTQAKFVPLNASALIIVNALTGMIIWQDWLVVGNWIGYICIFVQLVLGNYLLLGDVELLSTDNTHYGRAKSIVMLKGQSISGWDPSLYEIDEEGSSEEEEALSMESKEEPENGKYLSIAEPAPLETSGGQRQRRHSLAHEAWTSIYGLDSRHVSPRRHSIFAMDTSSFSEMS